MRYMLGIILVVFGAVGLLTMPQAEAQVFSSKGVLQDDSGQRNLNSCIDEAGRAQERALEIQERINRVLTCNNQGQLYDPGTGSCVTPLLAPDHRYTEDNAGDTIALQNPDGSYGPAARVGGRRGADLVCYAGCTFDGQTYTHGDSVVAYRENVVTNGRSCDTTSNTQTRRCNNGTMSGSYRYSTCDDTNDCTFNGTTIAHGSTVTAYLSDNPGAGQSCSSQTRTCNNGSLSGTYEYASCGDEDPCTFNGESVPHGGSVTAYEFERVSAGGTCNSERRVCTNGSLSGSFAYNSCETDLPVTPEPPTTDCFFWVSGYVPSAASVATTDNLSNHVGRGAYPDAEKPFAKANSGTFDSIAIGPKTRLVIYKGKNFKNGEFIDIHGPMFIGNQCLSSQFSRAWKTATPTISSTIGLSDKFKVNSSKYVNMFPPNKRIERVMNGTSAGCESNPPVAGAASQALLWGGGSVKVFCDAD